MLGGAPTNGAITISGSETQTVANLLRAGIPLLARSFPSALTTCNYNGMAIANCDAGGSSLAAPTAQGKTLKLGITATVDGTQAAGFAPAPSFTVTIVYG